MTDLEGTHVMVDIETMGKTPGHAILSIGAVIFDVDGIHSEFEEIISLESCLDHGMKIDDDTVDWLERQEASFTVDGRPLEDVLQDFSDWLPNGRYKVWANSPSFDCNFLKDAYSRCGMELPWDFWEQRDVRTAEEFYAYVSDDNAPNPDIDGNPHEPLFDAKEQALTVLMSQRKVRDELS